MEKFNELIEQYFLPLKKWWWLYLLITYQVFRSQGKRIWSSFRFEKWKVWKKTLTFLIFFVTLHFLLKSILLSLSLSHVEQSKLVQLSIKRISEVKSPLWYPLIFLGSCVWIPVLEECVFRYFIFETLGQKNSLSYALSFVSFILSHWMPGDNLLVLLIQYSVPTIAFITIYVNNKYNLLYPILLHSCTNLLLITLALIKPNFPLI